MSKVRNWPGGTLLLTVPRLSYNKTQSGKPLGHTGLYMSQDSANFKIRIIGNVERRKNRSDASFTLT